MCGREAPNSNSKTHNSNVHLQKTQASNSSYIPFAPRVDPPTRTMRYSYPVPGALALPLLERPSGDTACMKCCTETLTGHIVSRWPLPFAERLTAGQRAMSQTPRALARRRKKRRETKNFAEKRARNKKEARAERQTRQATARHK